MSSLQFGSKSFDFTPAPFPFPLLVEMLRTWAGDAATIDVNERAQLIWIFPRSAGSSVHLAVNEDECDVYAGLAFHERVLSSNTGDEGRVLDCVQAIAEGRAYEYYMFTGSPGNGRTAGLVGASYQGKLAGTIGGQTEHAQRRQVSPWAIQPAPA